MATKKPKQKKVAKNTSTKSVKRLVKKIANNTTKEKATTRRKVSTKKFLVPQVKEGVIKSRNLAILILVVVVVIFGAVYLTWTMDNRSSHDVVPYDSAKVNRAFLDATTGKDADGKDLSVEGRQSAYQDVANAFAGKLEIVPDNIYRLQKLAAAYVNLGELDKAKDVFASIVEIDPENALAHNNFADSLERIGEYTEAEKHYQEAIRIRPGLEAPYVGLASMLHDSMDRGYDAIAILQKGEKNVKGAEAIRDLLKNYRGY